MAVAWADGTETFFRMEDLRAASPSAANIGEKDIFGRQYGGDGPKSFPGVRVLGYEPIGQYAIRLVFSDGHGSGIFSFEYLKHLAETLDASGGH